MGDNWERCLFIYSCYAQQISFEINLNSKEIRRAGHEYMNKHTPHARISVLVTSPAKNVYCLQTLAKIAVSLLEYSDEYHEEYPFSYILVRSIKADKNQTCQLCSIFFVKAITFEFWLHQLYKQILKGYLAVLPILIVDHGNTARESGLQSNMAYASKYDCHAFLISVISISNFKMYYYKTGL